MNDVLKKQLREAIEAAQSEAESMRAPETCPMFICDYMMDLLLDIEGACNELCAVVPND